MNYKCFMLRETDIARCWLRRYQDSGDDAHTCNHLSYHNACVLVEDLPLIRSVDNTVGISKDANNFIGDPRWPTKCDSCPYVFADYIGKNGKRISINNQLFFLEVYLTPDGKEVSIHENSPSGLEKAPPGAMFYSDWRSRKGPDGHCLSVMTPDGIWTIDGCSSDGKYPWTRTGVPPNITVTPSIQMSKYHGWLKNGELVDA